MLRKRLIDLLAIGLIGDGIVALIAPSQHSALWTGGPEFYRRLNRPFIERPMFTRAFVTVQIALGLWITLKQYFDE